MKITVKYSEYKNRYEGFEKSKDNYNAEDKTIEIEIAESVYERLQDRPRAGAILQEIRPFVNPQWGNRKVIVLEGAQFLRDWYESNKEIMGTIQEMHIKRAIEIMEELEEVEERIIAEETKKEEVIKESETEEMTNKLNEILKNNEMELNEEVVTVETALKHLLEHGIGLDILREIELDDLELYMWAGTLEEDYPGCFK